MTAQASATLPERPSAPAGVFRRKERIRPLEYGFWLAMLAAALLLPDYSLLMSQALIMGLFAISLDLLIGYAGITSMGHAVFFGLGGYTAGLLGKYGWSEPLSGLVVAAAVSALAGYLVSLFLVRLSGIVLIIVTLIVCLVVYEFANQAQWLTGGESGLSGIVISPILDVFEFDFFGRVALAYSFVTALLGYFALRYLVATPFGLSLAGLRENVRRLPAIGISPARRVSAAFAISAAVAGVAGAVLVQTNQFVSLEVLSFDRSVAAVIIVALGGSGTLIGPMIAAIVYMVARDYIASLQPLYWYFWLGLLLSLSVFRPAFATTLTRMLGRRPLAERGARA